jgi:hypothetical protein
MNTFAMQHLLFVVISGTARRALLLRAGQSPLEPHLTTVPSGDADRKRATPIQLVGSRKESDPAKHLDRVWPDVGPEGIV